VVTGMKRRLLALPLVAAVAVAGTGTAAPAATPTLTGTVGPGFTISLKRSGTKVTRVRAGTYKIRVSDRSNIHNFHLTGSGVNRRTSVSGTGTTTWTVRLRRGTYRFVCDPHATMMKGSFTVR
jgi:plastocyanin